MGKFDQILLLTDVDGTLFNSKMEVSPENLYAIRYFIAEGGRFSIATGRISSSIERFLPGLPMSAPGITYNGGAVYDFHKRVCLWRETLPTVAREAAMYIMDRLPFVGLEVYHENDLYVFRKNAMIEEHLALEQLSAQEALIEEFPHPWTKLIFVQEPDETPHVIEEIRKSPFFSEYTFSKSSSKYYEMLKKGVDKGSMLMRLCKMLGIPAGRCIAIGDNENDVHMLQAAKVGVAVSNAKQEALAAADEITVSNNEHAIASVIKKLEKGGYELDPPPDTMP